MNTAARQTVKTECQLLTENNNLTWARGNLRAAKFRQTMGADNIAEIDYYAECVSASLSEVERLRSVLAA